MEIIYYKKEEMKNYHTPLNILTNITKIKNLYKKTDNIITLDYYIENHSNIKNLVIIYNRSNKNYLLNLLKKYPPPFHTYVYSYINKDKTNIITLDDLKEKKINVIKFINVNLTNDIATGFKRLHDSKNNYDYINVSPDYDYDYFIYKYYPPKCNYSNRIIQHSGTCWLNAIVNGFILSQEMRKICTKLITQNESNVVLDFFKFILSDEMKSYNDKDYDFIKKFAVHIKSATINKIKFLTNENGLLWTFNYSIFYYLLTHLYNDKNIVHCLNKHPQKILNLIFFKNMYKKYNNNLFVHISDKFEIVPKYIIVNDNKYNLIVCTIQIKNLNSQDNHLVCGYKCNGKYYIYDSSDSVNIEIDWRYSSNFTMTNIKFISYDLLYIKK